MPVPFQGTLTGDVARTPVPPLVFVEIEASGNATLLGHYALDVPHLVDPVARLAFGTYEFTAANGDMLSAHFAGQSMLTETPGVLYIVETAVIADDGTGRFAGAAGSFITERWFDMSTGTTYGTFDGTMSAPGAGNP